MHYNAECLLSAIINLKSEIKKTRARRDRKWARLDSNQQPTPYEGAALPLSYRPLFPPPVKRGKVANHRGTYLDSNVLRFPPRDTCTCVRCKCDLRRVGVERETGIGPASLAWKARALPLCYSRVFNSRATHPIIFTLVGARGLEPPTSSSQTMRATNCATPRQRFRVYANLVESSNSKTATLR